MSTQSDDLFAPLVASPTISQGCVLCDFAGLTLALDRCDVATIEHGGDLAAPLPGEAVVGWYESSQGPWPVYALDQELHLCKSVPPNRAFIAFLKSDAEPVGLLCENVRIVGSREELSPRELPSLMRNEHHPIRSIARLSAQRIALLAEPGSFVRYVHDLANGALVGATL